MNRPTLYKSDLTIDGVWLREDIQSGVLAWTEHAFNAPTNTSSYASSYEILGPFRDNKYYLKISYKYKKP